MLVQLYGTLRGDSGVRQVDVGWADDTRVANALAAALAQEPRVQGVLLDTAGEMRQDLLVLRNGRDIRLQQGMDTRLAPADRIDIFPMTGAQRAFASDW